MSATNRPVCIVKRAASIFCFCLSVALSLGGKARAAEAGTLHFDRDIRPLLSDHCFACHGPDSGKRKAGLRLDTREGLFGTGKSGATAVVPGQPDASELLKRITTADKSELMPPPKTSKPLTTAQITLLRRWVEQGAPWSPGWGSS